MKILQTVIGIAIFLGLQGCGGSDGDSCCSGGMTSLDNKLSETSYVQEVPEKDANGTIQYVDRNVTVVEYKDRNVTIIKYVDRNVTQYVDRNITTYVDRNVTVEVIKVRPDAVLTGFTDGAVLRDATLTLGSEESEDSDGSIVAYRWILDDVNVSTKANPTIDLPTEEGTHKICLVVTDNDGLESKMRCRSFTIPHANSNPTAVMTGLDNNGGMAIKTLCPISVSAKDTIATDTKIVSYLWSIDDNQTLQGADQNLSFLTTGVHKVCLKVTDENGLSDRQCSDVTVDKHVAPTVMMQMKDSNDQIITQDMNLTRRARYDFSCAGSHDDCNKTEGITCEWNAHSYRIGEKGEKIDYINDCMKENNAPSKGESSWVQLCQAGADKFKYVEITLKVTDRFGNSTDKLYVYGVDE